LAYPTVHPWILCKGMWCCATHPAPDRRGRASPGVGSLARRGLSMSKDVDEPAQRIPDVETAHTPGLACRAVLYHYPGLSHAALDLIKVIHLDRDVRHRRPRASFGCDAYLRCHLRRRGKRDDPPLIHYNFKAEDIGVEMSGLRHVGRGKVADDALDDHI